MRTGVVVFPGSNCDQDCYYVLRQVVGQPVTFLWHKETRLPDLDALILPGGFSYGDYLRCGAIARFSPIMESVHRFADAGGLVLGICNGFQILLESGLLPGAMLRNRSLKFICDTVRIRTERTDTPFTRRCSEGLVLRLPIAHAEGRYFADPSALRRLEDRRQVVFRYCGPDGEPGEGSNPNGSLNAIAGICNEKGNVLGLMPHPERMSEEVLGGKDGLLIFESMMESVLRGVAG